MDLKKFLLVTALAGAVISGCGNTANEIEEPLEPVSAENALEESKTTPQTTEVVTTEKVTTTKATTTKAKTTTAKAVTTAKVTTTIAKKTTSAVTTANEVKTTAVSKTEDTTKTTVPENNKPLYIPDYSEYDLIMNYDDFDTTLEEANGRVTRTIKWHGANDTSWSNQVTFNKSSYDYYSQQPRVIRSNGGDEWLEYINNKDNRQILKAIANALTAEGERKGLQRDQIADEVIRYVQSIEYQLDIDSKGVEEYPKYPVETLYEGCGDCEDVSILMAGVLRELGYKVCFLEFPGHYAVGIAGGDNVKGSYYEYKGTKYFYVEATGEGMVIGQLPTSIDVSSGYLIEIHEPLVISPEEFTKESYEENGKVTRLCTWKGIDGFATSAMGIDFNKSAYDYYSTQPRIEDISQWSEYINDENNRKVLKFLADEFVQIGEICDYSKVQIFYEVIRYVQHIEYTHDIDSRGYGEYPKYPIETIYEGIGDTEDISFLLAGILRELGYKVCFFESNGFFGVGISGINGLNGANLNYNGTTYYCIVPTNAGMFIWSVPEEMGKTNISVYEV